MRDICGMSAGHAARCPRGRRLPLVVGYTWDDVAGLAVIWPGCARRVVATSTQEDRAADCLGQRRTAWGTSKASYASRVSASAARSSARTVVGPETHVGAHRRPWRRGGGETKKRTRTAWPRLDGGCLVGDVRERRDSGATHRGISQPATQRTGPPGPLDGWVTQGACPVGGSRPALVEGVSWLPPRITGCAARRLPVVCRNRCSFVPLLWRTPRVRSAPSR